MAYKKWLGDAKRRKKELFEYWHRTSVCKANDLRVGRSDEIYWWYVGEKTGTLQSTTGKMDIYMFGDGIRRPWVYARVGSATNSHFPFTNLRPQTKNKMLIFYICDYKVFPRLSLWSLLCFELKIESSNVGRSKFHHYYIHIFFCSGVNRNR